MHDGKVIHKLLSIDENIKDAFTNIHWYECDIDKEGEIEF